MLVRGITPKGRSINRRLYRASKSGIYISEDTSKAEVVTSILKRSHGPPGVDVKGRSKEA